MKLKYLFCLFSAVSLLTIGCHESSSLEVSTDEYEVTYELCSDGEDNNNNGVTDCDDDVCSKFEHCMSGETDKVEICDNWKDDDGDGLADCGDSDCANADNCKNAPKDVEICDNWKDDDGDGFADCGDSDCADAANCKGETDKVEICDNWKDDDGDGLADCGDSDCADAANCKGDEPDKVEICDNGADDDGDGLADCDDSDCADAANCKGEAVKTEICDNGADDDGDGLADCDDSDCEEAAKCKGEAVKTEICDNGADDNGDGLADCDDPICLNDDNCIVHDFGKLKYKVGLISDIHFDTDNNHNAEHENDLTNALTYFRNNNIEFIANCGDVAEYKTEDFDAFKEYYNAWAWAPTYGKLRLFTALGNHDYLQMSMIPDNVDKDVWIGKLKGGFNSFTGEENKDMHFFEYNGKWDEQYSADRTNQSKLSYWWQKDNEIYVFLSLDYGDTPLPGTWGVMARAMNLLDMNDNYVKQMESYVADTEYNQSKDKLFNYQFYHPNTLIWVKDIIENNTDKRIFVFTHHFLTHKAGNGIPYSGGAYYSDRRVWPYNSNEQILKKVYAGANSLSGLEFHFINKLNNKHKNVMWFSGHTHYQWEDSSYDSCLNFCNKDFEFVLPTGDEITPLVDDIKTVDDYKRYTRKSDTPRGECGYTVHIPSLSKPVSMATNSSLYKASQGGIMEVYENGVKIQGISFKKNDAGNYENQIVVTKEIYQH